jgi:SAM-dependent methyltransferase
MTAALSPSFSHCYGIDYDFSALLDRRGEDAGGTRLVNGDAMALPLPADVIDVIICAQVYEHVPDDRRLINELRRVLKAGGVIFFSGPNWLFPIEPHYGLPFLHWLPKSLQSKWLSALGVGGAYYEKARSYWDLRSLFRGFSLVDVGAQVFLDQLADHKVLVWFASYTPARFWNLILPFLPNFNWVLVKSTR